MPRPQKQTVEYFPHYCDHKTTIFILEQKYGNDGYAFWFKLLEMLGKEEGHYLNLQDPMRMEFLQAKTRLSEITTIEILNLLAKLNAIDQELWKEKIVWSDNFVRGLKPVYTNRRVEIPPKPSILHVETLPLPTKLQEEIPKGSKVKEVKEANIVNTKYPPVDNFSNPKPNTQKDASFKKPKTETSDDVEKQELRELVNLVIVKHPRFAIHTFLGNHNRDHPKAILHVLRSLLKTNGQIDNPMAYCEAAIKIENGKYNARDTEAKHEVLKKPTGTEMEVLGSIMQRAINQGGM